MRSGVAVMPRSNSRYLTSTIYCSFSGMASIAKESPERPGPIRLPCDGSVGRSWARAEPPEGTRLVRIPDRPGGDTRPGSHATTVEVVSHSPKPRACSAR